MGGRFTTQAAFEPIIAESLAERKRQGTRVIEAVRGVRINPTYLTQRWVSQARCGVCSERASDAERGFIQQALFGDPPWIVVPGSLVDILGMTPSHHRCKGEAEQIGQAGDQDDRRAGGQVQEVR
jgi:hypothetical protein